MVALISRLLDLAAQALHAIVVRRIARWRTAQRVDRGMELRRGKERLREPVMHQREAVARVQVRRIDLERELVGRRRIGEVSMRERDVALMVALVDDPLRDRPSRSRTVARERLRRPRASRQNRMVVSSSVSRKDGSRSQCTPLAGKRISWSEQGADERPPSRTSTTIIAWTSATAVPRGPSGRRCRPMSGRRTARTRSCRSVDQPGEA